MKKYVMLALAAILSLGISTSAQNQSTERRAGQGQGGGAQDGQRNTGMQFTAKDRAERLATQLELTDVEKAKVLEMYEKLDAKREEAKKQNQEVNTNRREQLEAQRKAEDVELEKILSKEKFEKHKANRAEREKRMREREGNAERQGGNR
ncbi:MAG: hypothetical protein Q7U47_14520 [Paludibacter sp.]|nr:hypothetical protein [Paludibacter sp.]